MNENGLSILGAINSLSDKEMKEISFQRGEMIGNRYEVMELIGAGGMGAVYLVKDRKLQDDLKALKLMLPKLTNDPNARQRFLNEILVSQKMIHRNILRVYDYDQDGPLMFFTMEYIDGKNMRLWLREEQSKQAIALDRIGDLVVELLDALELAHKFTVHHDIKPENILIPQNPIDSKIKVCDFGLAQLQNPALLFSTNKHMGTYNYMAPEQQTDMGNIDKRADLYSVGVLLYEALTGKFPIGRFKLPTQLRTDLPEDIDLFIEKALAPDPQERFADAKEMKTCLMDLMGALPKQDERKKPSTALLNRIRPSSVTPSLKEKTPPMLARIVKEKTGIWHKEDFYDPKSALEPKPLETKDISRITKSSTAFSKTVEPSKEAPSAIRASTEIKPHFPRKEDLRPPKSGIWNPGESPKEDLRPPKSGIWNPGESPKEDLRPPKSGIWNPGEMPGKAPSWKTDLSSPKSGVWTQEEFRPLPKRAEHAPSQYESTAMEGEDAQEEQAHSSPKAFGHVLPKTNLQENLEKDLERLREKLPPNFVSDFVREHRGLWGYEEYQVLEKKAKLRIGDIEGSLFFELLEEERRKYLEDNTTGRRSRVKDQFSTNLKRVEASGLVMEFVQKNKGKWSDKDWRQFLSKLEQRGFYPLDEEQLRYMLHQCRNRYLHAQEKAPKNKQMLQSLEKVHQYEDARDLLLEIRHEGYWDEYFEQQEERIRQILEEFHTCLEEGKTLIESDKMSLALVKLQQASQLKPSDPALLDLFNQVKQKQDYRRKQYQQMLQEGDRFAYAEKKYEAAIEKWNQALHFTDSPEHEEQIRQRLQSAEEKSKKWQEVKNEVTQIQELPQKTSVDLERVEKLLADCAPDHGHNPDFQNLKKWQEENVSNARQKSQEQYTKLLSQINQWVGQGKFDQALHSLSRLAQEYGASEPMKETIVRLTKAKEILGEIENLRNIGNLGKDYNPAMYSEKMLGLCRQMKKLAPEFTRTRQWEIQVSQHQFVQRQLSQRNRKRSIHRWIFVGVLVLLLIPLLWQGGQWLYGYLKQKQFDEVYAKAEKFYADKKWRQANQWYTKAHEIGSQIASVDLTAKMEETKRHYEEQQKSFRLACDKAKAEVEKGRWPDGLRWYREAQRIGLQDVKDEIYKIRPADWPLTLWQNFWNIETESADFTSREWEKLSFDLQFQYAKQYQKWYSEYKNLPVHKLKMLDNVKLILVLIPPGRFWRGSLESEKERENDERRHKVFISQPFYIGKYEVLQSQWLSVMRTNPASFQGNLDFPVEQVSWEDAQKFCEKTNLSLPTEAQWEYACRAGSLSPFNLGANITTDMANYDGNKPYPGFPKGISRKSTIRAASLKSPNAWACHDFHGNVWEWCLDWAEEYPTTEQKDPSGPEKGICRILRGGSWIDYGPTCRSANRLKDVVSSHSSQIGFRVVSE